MGNRHDDRSSRRSTLNDGRQGGSGGPEDLGRGSPRPDRPGGDLRSPQRGEPGRSFDRDEDMGGSHWSGASGRGGYGSEAFGPRAPREHGLGGGGGYPGAPGERGHERNEGYGEYPREGGYSEARRYASFSGTGASHEGRHEDHEEGSFLSEDSPGHVPNQRWSGGYGADRDRELERAGWQASGPPSGRGFTGSDFGGPPRRRDRAYGAPADVGPRHFGNEVDRGGRMGWGREPDRDRGYGMGGGYGYPGTDMGMGGPPDEDRGPHYGKGPKGYKRSDERTREDVCDAIAHQGHIDATDVEVKVEGGIVTLSGTVIHRHDKRGLEHIAERCRGVHEVHNELRLKRSDAGKHQKQQQQQQQQQVRQDKPADVGDGSANRGIQNGKTARS